MVNPNPNPNPNPTQLDDQLIAAAAPAIERGEPVDLSVEINNLIRSVGAMLSHEIAKRHGA